VLDFRAILASGGLLGWYFQDQRATIQNEPKLPTGLSAKITRMENRGGGYYAPLIVVENTSNVAYEATQWSCTFYKGDEPVSEDTFWVNQVVPNGKTAHRSTTRLSQPFDSISCRLLSVRE
jgi:hypothetical protein